MIEELRISGVGVIDSATLQLSPGFTVITGETGAGKTMILTALRLLLGEKSDAALVRTGHKQIEVDGIFATSKHVRTMVAEAGLESDEELIVCRTVPAKGRSRATAQGRPVPLRVLQDIVDPLITIHGQSDQWRVRRADVQRELLDLYGGQAHHEILRSYRQAWRAASDIAARLEQLHADHDQREVEARYLAELVAAIDELGPVEGEDDALSQQIERYANVAELSSDVAAAYALLYGDDRTEGAGDALSRAAGTLVRLEHVDPQLSEHTRRLEQAQAEISDVADELRDYLDHLEDDPDELARLQQRRADLENMMKGRATTVTELVAWSESARARLAELRGEGTDPELVAEQLETANAEVNSVGAELHSSRKKAASNLANAVNTELEDLAMIGATFRVDLQETEPGPFGVDQVSLDLRARADGPFRPLSDGASGGEISRIMLALELAVGRRRDPGTYVFDEVDQGVGGHTATELGRRLSRLAESQQVIAVTHLPQVAAFADKHFVLSRSGTLTEVHEVQGDAQVTEIVRMLGAELGSASARRHAEELLAGKRDKIDPKSNPEVKASE